MFKGETDGASEKSTDGTTSYGTETTTTNSTYGSETSSTFGTTTGSTLITSEGASSIPADPSEATGSDVEFDSNSDWNKQHFLLPQDILSLDGRHIRAEDPNWAMSPVPDLTEIIVKSAGHVQGPELRNLILNSNTEQLKRILEILPLNIPFKYTLPIDGIDFYWERQCKERWAPSESWRYDDDWKTMFVEKTVEEVIANFDPEQSDIKELVEFINTFTSHTFRLQLIRLKKITKKSFQVDLESEDFDKLLDDFIAEPEDDTSFLDFEAVLSSLSELREFSLIFNTGSLDNKIFQLSVSDFNSLLRGIRRLDKLQRFRCSNGIASNLQLSVLSRHFLQHRSLTELNLSYNFIDDTCCDYIGKLLLSACPLETLIIRNNRIADDGVVTISAALSANRKLRRLDLALNWIGDSGGAFLAKVVSVHPTIEDLDVSCNKLGRKAGLSFGDAVRRSKCLRSLILAENDLGEEVGNVMSSAMDSNPIILHLDIQFCSFSPPDEDVIYNAIVRNRYTVLYSTYVGNQNNATASEFLI